MNIIEIENLNKSFGDLKAVNDITFITIPHILNLTRRFNFSAYTNSATPPYQMAGEIGFEPIHLGFADH